MASQHKLLGLGIALLAVLGFAVGAEEAQAPEVRFDIQAQPLGDALNAFAQQSGMQVVFYSGVGEGLSAPRLMGTFSPKAALEQLLAHTQLEYEFADQRSVIIRKSSTAPVSGIGTQRVQDARVAQAEIPSPSQGEGGGADQEGSPGASASSEAEKSKVQEIVVTAQKRVERLQDVPISIAVLGGEQLDKTNTQGLVDILNRVPAVVASTNSVFGRTSIQIRGIAGDAGGNTVGYYLDGAPFSFIRSERTPDPSAYDLERVEVLRGPQGTLYGVSSQAGVVRVLTRKADATKFEAKGRTGISLTEGGGENYRADGALNIPLIEDKLAVRGTLGYQDNSGWIESATGSDINSSELKTGRLKVAFDPTDKLSINGLVWVTRNHYDAPSGADSNNLRITDLTEPADEDYEVYSLEAGYDADDFTLTGSTSYIDYINDSFLDYSPVGLRNARIRNINGSKAFTQEIAFRSNGEGDWRWTLGAIYRRLDELLYQQREDAQGRPVGSYQAPNSFTDHQVSRAAYGEVTRLLAGRRLEITLGGRYYEDDDINQEGSNQNLLPLFTPIVTSASKFSPRAVLTWHASPDLTTYASYSEGFRTGASQGAGVLRVVPNYPPLQPDNLVNYEAGAKGSLFDGRITFDGAIYYMDWTDIQQVLAVRVGGTDAAPIFFSAPVNGKSASGLGAELGVKFKVFDSLSFTLNGAWNDLTFDEDVISRGFLVFPKGSRISYSPERSLSAGLDYQRPISSDLDIRLSLGANHTSAKESRTLVGTTSTLSVTDDYFDSRASVSLVGGAWELTGFVENLSDYNKLPAGNQFGVAQWTTRVRPRTIGAQFEFKF